jgi:2,4-dienoyl-CoA reductase (NADPH2)
MTNYNELFSPLKLKNNEIKNRVLMGSMHTGLEEAKNGYHKMAKFYGERAKAGVGLITTGGISPNFAGRVQPLASQLSFPWQVSHHKIVTDEVHRNGGKICMQILHAGRYAYHPLNVSASAIKSPITPFKPFKMSKLGIMKTIWDFGNSARLAQKAGYDGVEIMGSEGYLLNQFICPKTNKRTDKYGGSFENRIRIVKEILETVRKKTSKEFIIIFRLSMLDLVEDGSSWEEVVKLGKIAEQCGVDLINTGIGWHESRVPTIATMVPRAAFTWITEKFKSHVSIPVITTNRINDPEVANTIIKSNQADMISMARPFLADPELLLKAQEGRADEINTCIGCNQACLDHIFKNQICSCLVNPKACHEVEFEELANRDRKIKKVAVIGAGPAGISFAIEAKTLGHEVTVFEGRAEIGGQFNIAKEIPGKEEFHETLRYFKTMVKKLNIDMKLNTKVDLEFLKKSDFDTFVFSTGIKPRIPNIKGDDKSITLDYSEVLYDKKPVGKRVAIIGAGGIGFDVAEFLAHNPNHKPTSLDKEEFFNEWGIDTEYKTPGSLKDKETIPSHREIYLLQRKITKHGKNLGKTTGWIHRQSLNDKGITMLKGIQYEQINSDSLVIKNQDGSSTTLEVDNIIYCSGQVSQNELYNAFKDFDSRRCHLIGGALLAAEIDAKRAINEGIRLAYEI